MNSKQMVSIAICLLVTFLSLAFVSAAQTITITQNETFIEFDATTFGYEWDEQEIEFSILESFGIEIPEQIKNVEIGLTLSEFIDEIDFRAEFNEGETYPEFTSFNLNNLCSIEFDVEGIDLGFGEISVEDATIDFLLPLIKQMPGFEGTLLCDEIDTTVLNNLIHQNSPEAPEMIGNTYIEKQGINYGAGYDLGYGDIPSEYHSQIEEVIETAFYSANTQLLQSYFDMFEIPSYEVSVDLSDVELENGSNEIVVTFDSLEYIIGLNLEGITFPEPEPQNITYIPINPEVLGIISYVARLKTGTIVSVEILETSPYNIPDSLNQINILNISTNQETEGLINFQVSRSDVTDKNNIALYIWEDTWNELVTNLISEDGDYYTYESEIPHFSIFMIAETIEVEDEEDEEDGGSSSSSSSSNWGGSYTPVTIVPPEPTDSSGGGIGDTIGTRNQPEENDKGNKGLLIGIIIFTLIIGISVLVFVIVMISKSRKGEQVEEIQEDIQEDIQEEVEEDEE